MITDGRELAESETAGKNRPGYKSAPHENRSDILAEGEKFVADGLTGHCLTLGETPSDQPSLPLVHQLQ